MGNSSDAARSHNEGESPAPEWLNLPNMISLARIPLAVLFVTIDVTLLRLGIVAAAAGSDWADGVLARRTRRVTHLGEVLDPVADRTFMITALIWMAAHEWLPWWTLPLLLLRDAGVMIGAVVVLAIDRRMRFPARTTGKRLTWLQLIAIGLILVQPNLAPVIAIPIAVMGAAALADYGRHALASLKRARKSDPRTLARR